MANKIITKTDSNLITLQYQDVSEEALSANELLVKQLIFILKNNQQMISPEDQTQINDYQILSQQLNRVLSKLGLDTVSEINILVDNQSKLINLKDEKLNQLEARFEQDSAEYQKQIATLERIVDEQESKIQQLAANKTQLETNVEQLETKNKQLTLTGEKYKRQYEGQKNRKVVRFVDKVARR